MVRVCRDARAQRRQSGLDLPEFRQRRRTRCFPPWAAHRVVETGQHIVPSGERFAPHLFVHRKLSESGEARRMLWKFPHRLLAGDARLLSPAEFEQHLRPRREPARIAPIGKFLQQPVPAGQRLRPSALPHRYLCQSRRSCRSMREELRQCAKDRLGFGYEPGVEQRPAAGRGGLHPREPASVGEASADAVGGRWTVETSERGLQQRVQPLRSSRGFNVPMRGSHPPATAMPSIRRQVKVGRGASFDHLVGSCNRHPLSPADADPPFLFLGPARSQS